MGHGDWFLVRMNAIAGKLVERGDDVGHGTSRVSHQSKLSQKNRPLG